MKIGKTINNINSFLNCATFGVVADQTTYDLLFYSEDKSEKEVLCCRVKHMRPRRSIVTSE